jgi:serine phosphatase RsbU (regulator of sigma subunit)
VVLMTDGVTEALDERGQMLGDDATRKLVLEHRKESAESLVQVVISAVERHAGGARSDDTTVVVLEVGPRSSAAPATAAREEITAGPSAGTST